MVAGILLAPVVADADQVMPAPQGFSIVRKGGTDEWWIGSISNIVSSGDLCECVKRVYNNYARNKPNIKVILYNITTLRP